LRDVRRSTKQATLATCCCRRPLTFEVTLGEDRPWRQFRHVALGTLAACLPFAARGQDAAGPVNAVTTRADFPGGNIQVVAQEEDVVHIAPDLRGDRPWFYWCFEARAARPGRVKFVFPDKVAGFTDGAIGFQGPAISMDQGASWRWMGTERVEGSSFSYEFLEHNQCVRFAVTIPYLQKDLAAFLDHHADNPHLTKSVLATSRKGREVELLQIGSVRPQVHAVLVTARHHAAETIASYVLEGFLQEALSESEAGVDFRKRFALFAVPFVDKDGVEEGDQGKNRLPHDHNRDYGSESIYPEIQAIKELDRKHDFRFALDFHCPTLVMEDHQVMYFVGAKQHPRHNFQNVSEFAGWIRKRLPATAPAGPHVWLQPAELPLPMNSHYFGFKKSAIMAATLEIPFAPPGRATDPASCRDYGRKILEAWVRTEFQDTGE
jgi:hypothetical protein